MSQLRRVAVAIVTVMVAAALASCGGSNGDSSSVLRIGTSSGISSPNPFVGYNQDDYSVWTYIYPTLLQYDTTKSGFPYAGNFARKWSTSTDGRTVTFHTVPDASWSDGTPLTADDAAWTLTMIKKYAHGPTATWAGSVRYMTSARATDKDTLVVTYRRPVASAYSDVGMTPILPRQVWGQYATGNGKQLTTFENVPENGKPLVGGGPFVMTKYTKDSIALFARNSHWYGPAPHISGFGLQFFHDEDAMITALKTGQLDAINEIPPTSVSSLQKAGQHVYVGPALSLRDLIINSDPNKTKNRELLDPQVRKAMEYAVDRDAIVKTAWLGYASPGASLVPAGNATGGTQWHDPDISPLPFDIDKANQILDSLGYQRGGNGIRVADGHQMSYNVIFPQDEEGAGDRAFQIIQRGFRQIGIAITQTRLDDDAAFQAIYGGKKSGYQFDLAMWDWFPAADPGFILDAMTCKQYGDWNDSGYCTKQYDALDLQQDRTTNASQRQSVVFQMQQMIYAAKPYIILTYDKRLDAWSPKWTGFVESPQGFFNNFSTQSLLSVRPA
ncbi:MAG TPA: peptide ABC transporter substrate-binding protein [Nocardioides sp.]|jgi:peptide/nickel transport system substrate-binding protein|nr:peptide ABC transporter substrate-binding protein [Nocardioides sp.]